MSTLSEATREVASSPLGSQSRLQAVVWPALRICLGLVFFWAFLDKLFALGFATGRNPETGEVARFGPAAWINGASPTKGFLSFGTDSPLTPMFQAMAGNPLVDILFMMGMGGVGLAVILGIATRIATVSGVLLMVSLRLALLVPGNNPIVDEHLIYALLLIGIAAVPAARGFSLNRRWQNLGLVQRCAFLR